MPHQHHELMTDFIKDNIETLDLKQLISTPTRTWKDQEDFTIDNIWSNCNNHTIKHYNVVRGSSDHNAIGMIISMKNIKLGGNNIVKRCWEKISV